MIYKECADFAADDAIIADYLSRSHEANQLIYQARKPRYRLMPRCYVHDYAGTILMMYFPRFVRRQSMLDCFILAVAPYRIWTLEDDRVISVSDHYPSGCGS